VPLVTDVPEGLRFRGIEPAREARSFAIELDRAEPWGGGAIEGRVERRHDRHDRRPVRVDLRCEEAWLDVAPQLVGRKRLLSWSLLGDIRTKAVPVWLDDELFHAHVEVGALENANWRPFAFELPAGLPRPLEGTFVAFRWRIEARRRRRLGVELASHPLLLVAQQREPVVRVETSPIGTWRLLEWRSEEELGGDGGRCSIVFADRRPEDMPLAGETRETELARRARP
jgi:hypothetical protein